MADDADRSLVHQLQMRNPEAWARTYDNHASDVFTFIAHLLHGDRAAAEEIHQNTWLAALSGIAAFDVERGELRAWIFGIARRQVALHFRRLGQSRLEASDDNAAAGLARRVAAAARRDRRNRTGRRGAARRWPKLAPKLAAFCWANTSMATASMNWPTSSAGRRKRSSRCCRACARMRQLLAWYFDTENATKDVRP